MYTLNDVKVFICTKMHLYLEKNTYVYTVVMNIIFLKEKNEFWESCSPTTAV